MDTGKLGKNAFLLWCVLIVLVAAPLVYYLNINRISSDLNRSVVVLFNLLYSLLAVAGFSMAAFRSQRISRQNFLGWLFLAFGTILILLANFMWLLQRPITIFSIMSQADLAYASSFLMFFTSMAIFAAQKFNHIEWIKRSLDVSIILVVIILAFHIFLFKPLVVANQQVNVTGNILLLLYPLADMVFLLSVLAVIYFRPHRMYLTPFWVLIGSIMILTVTDYLFCQKMVSDSFSSNQFINIGWWYADLLFAVAGFLQARYAKEYQGVQKKNTKNDIIRRRIYAWLAYFPYVMVVGAYLLVIFYFDSPLEVSKELLIGVGVIILLVILRQLVVVQENKRLLRSLSKAMHRLRMQAMDLSKTNQDLQVEIEKRNVIEEKLSYDAMHDSLTGLSNRVLFTNRLEHAFEKVKREPELDYAVLFLDLDNFKSINDILGHNAGDLALIDLGQRLGKCIRAADTLARFGGDEFVILLENTEDRNVTLSVANRILVEMQRPFLHNETMIAVTCSIGIVQSIHGYINHDDVLRDVDIAMYTAKKAGKARFEVFNIEMGTAATYQIEVEGELHRAITNKELFLQYQPVVDLMTGKITGFEALVRWQHPMRGLLEPDDFIPIAEDSGAINPIGDWVLRAACEQMKEWVEKFPEMKDWRLSINLSGKQLLKAKLVESIKEILDETNLDPRQLTLEITENSLVLDPSMLSVKINKLRAMGISISVDDFGTGYSSLYNLKNYAVDEIKIDNVFAEGIVHSQKDYEICKFIILMAKQLGIRTVIEGVEISEQLDLFSGLGCSFGQGYFLAKPMVAGDVQKNLLDVSVNQLPLV